ncbi:SRPBCC family protein [Gemmatimonas aurantiaca]|uniref:SRPBCC family protein n=1 Tax=Gemmatimonas aurantiaca TaxID=173480 RepID=UPI00301DE123
MTSPQTRAGGAQGPPFLLGPPPRDRLVVTIDEQIVRASPAGIFAVAAAVEEWPAHLAHYRHVRFLERRADGGGIVDMSANRPFGLLDWPTWWRSQMAVDRDAPFIRFHHIGGVTTGMDVEWSFTPVEGGTLTRIVHTWNGPHWPLVSSFAAREIIAPVFVHGIASRTLAGLAAVAERHSSRALDR